MNQYEKIENNIIKCKTRQELDEMRMPLVKYPNNGGSSKEFYKLQKLFRKQKNRIARHTV